MHIGIVTYDYGSGIGGLGIVAKRYRDLLAKDSNVKLTVFSPSLDADDSVSGVAQWLWKKPGGCPLFSLILFFRLSALVRKYQLDIVHVHAGSGGVFLLRKPKCRIVVTSHHTYIDEAKHVFQGRPIKSLWKKFMSILERRTYKLADRITCVSKDTADSLVHSYGIPQEKISVIENPVLAPPQSDVQKNEHTILFVGRLEERKGIWILLRAFKQVSESFPSVKLRLIGNNLLGSSLHDFLRKEGIEAKVELLGFVPDPERYSVMARASIIVVPSLLEGFGLIAAEAMLVGTCVIASDAPGLRSIIEDGKTGRLFPVNSDQACADAIEELLRSPEKRKMYAENAKKEAKRRFDPEERTKDILSVFRGAL